MEERLKQRKYNTGATFGEWTLIGRAGQDWIVRCSCGNTYTRGAGNISSGKSTRCIKCQVQVAADTKTNFYDDAWKIKTIRNIYTGGARRKGRVFELSDATILALISNNCFYCDLEPSNTRHTTLYEFKYSGIDRIDNDRGYVDGNVRSCCRDCNFAKRDMSESEFMVWIERVHSHVSK